MSTEHIPEENVRIYCHIYRVETALRELIIESLHKLEGPRWYKRRLPADVLERYRRAMDFERKLDWIKLIPHHPIYYVEFPDVRKTIVRNDNWEDIFRGIFSRKDILSAKLSELELIRNKIAHNRKATRADLKIVESSVAQLERWIGERYFDELTGRATQAPDLCDRLAALSKEATRAFNLCSKYEVVDNIDLWKSICDEWWFDESYLGHKLVDLYDFFEVVQEYLCLERSRGVGHKIQEWVKSNDLSGKFECAKARFADLISSKG